MLGKFLSVTTMLLCLNIQAATNSHSHPTSGEYRASGKALLDLGIASAKILANGAWIYWNSQQGPDYLITSLKQRFPEGLALEHLEYNDQQVLQVSASPEAGLPNIIIYPSPVQPESPSWLTPSKTLSLVNRETLHTVAQAFHYLTTGESAPSVETDPASREKAKHLATELTLLQRLHSSSQTPTPTPLGWDDDDKVFVFRHDRQLSDLPTSVQSVTDDVLKGLSPERIIKPSPVQSVSGGVGFSQGSYGPKSAGTSSAQASPPPPPPSPAAAQTDSSIQASPDGVSSSGTSSMTQSSNSLEVLPTNSLNDEQPFTVKYVTLPAGEVVQDYSHHPDFPRYMKEMTFSEAREIQALVKQYPNHYPMPGMAVTVEKMIEGIVGIKARKDLMSEDIEPLNNLERDVIQLKQDGKYPYRDSLILSYRFLHYKASLDYREQVETHARAPATTAKGWGHWDNWRQRDLSEALEKAGFKRTSFYACDCSLTKLEQIPWQDMLEDNCLFEQTLSSVYHSSALHRQPDPEVSGFRALISSVPLIPCTQELDITYFNCTVGIPLWLVGFSLSEKNRADGFDMGCSAFFDHDLFHLASILYELRATKSGEFDRVEEAENTLSNIRNLYACKGRIKKTVSFEALELVIFDNFHEWGFSDFKILMADWEITLVDLPPQYQSITKGQVKQALAWLRALNISPGDSLPVLEQKVKKNEGFLTPFELTKDDYEVYPRAPEIPAFIPPLIESIKNMADEITSAGFNYRHLIDLLRKYSMLEKIPENKIDLYQLFDCANPDQLEEAQWLVCYRELDSQEKLKTLLTAIHKQHSEYDQNYQQNIKKLLSVCRKTVENFLAESIKQNPEINESHRIHLINLALSLETMELSQFSHFDRKMPSFNRYVSYLILKDNHDGFWEKQDQVSPREPKPTDTFLSFGMIINGRVYIEILDRTPEFSKKPTTGY